MKPIRGLVVVSTIAAAIAEAYLANSHSPHLFWISLAAFVLMVVAGQRLRSLSLPILMAAIYLMPAIFLTTVGARIGGYGLDIVWIMPLLGLILSDRGALQWSLPARWQWPLVTWALVAAIAWPIVFLREANFALWILPLQRVSNTSMGISPWEVDQNVAYFALGHTGGILFIDALFRWYASDQRRFRRDTLSAMAIAATIAAIVAIYQGLIDLSFLNTGFWTYMIRASGTLADPNKLGAVVAFWTIGAVVFARRMTPPWSTVVTIAALMLGSGAVWLCGSRTGLVAVGVSVMIAAWEAFRAWRSTRSSRPVNTTRLIAMIAAAVALAIGLIVVLQNASTHTVIARGSWTYIPFYGDKSVGESVNELLWERFGYGPAAIEMIKEHPIEGVGVGTYHALSHDFGKLRGYALVPDNAQNWFRHTVAELGVLGSLPVLWWCAVLAMLMFARPGGDRLSFGMLRGVLIGFGVASMFGMPAQSMAIVITFWAFVFWLWSESGQALDDAAPVAWRKEWLIAAAVLVAAHAGMTTVSAFGDLRPQNRAQRFDWFYRYGYLVTDHGADLEADPGGNPVGRRWTMKDSLAVIPVKGKVLKFVAWLDHPDTDVTPVHLRVWADSKLVYEGDRRRDPLFLDIPATPGKSHLVLETSIDRTWRPSDAGSRDTRELGLSIRDWVWQ